MRPQRTNAVGSVTTSSVIYPDWKQNPFNVSLAVTLSGGANLTYKVQHSFDDPYDSTITAVWFDHDTITGKTADDDGNYAFPVRAIRLNVTAWTSGNATLTVLQGSSQ